ncbi:MAG: D-Ala-D-Ala carboxypeptidase family metallohydrolase, partial [Actinomycetota bacterium]|nr:D-Ala-D-Ala carboxypeptidase family metallohydrolase [Actinomycetota bacterium]
MTLHSSRSRFAAVVAIALLIALFSSAPALGRNWPKRLHRGQKGPHVRALQIRVAGWYPSWNKRRFHIDGSYGGQTVEAVKRFERRYGLRRPDGTASRMTFRLLNRIEDSDGSTEHFNWSEFRQHSNPGCSAQANAYAGTFGGGKVSTRQVKRNVHRLMWRLEALRKKGGSNPVGINSGFRSVPYNSCIGGASASQHLYGTAADNRVAAISNSKTRKIAKGTQFSGVSCYSYTTHNHFDIRIENSDYPGGQFWWWPRTDSLGRELDDSGRPCWGESTSAAAAAA